MHLVGIMKRCTLSNSFFFFFTVTGCRPTPNLEGQSTVFINPKAGWPSCTPRHSVPISVAFYDLHGLRWDYSFPRLPLGDPVRPTRKYLSLRRERINLKRWDKAGFMYGGRLGRNSYTFNQQLISCWASVNYRQVGDIRKDGIYTHRSA